MATDQNYHQIFLQRVAYLITGFLQATLTAAEQAELQAWTDASPENKQFFEQQTNPDSLQERLSLYEKFDTASAWSSFQEKHLPAAPPARVRPLFNWRWTAAAAILLLVGAAWYFRRDTAAPPPLAVLTTTPVVPGHSQATLTLADGSVIPLDSNGNRAIAQPGATAQQHNGQLQYVAQGNATAATMNTLTTPRGGQFQLTLPDGTKVWLNAASSITYPTAFTGDHRNVAIQGEVYFEVAAKEHQPFTVKVNQTTSIDVLGTGFNVNAYTDEPYVSTTLVQGAIKLNAGNTSRVLRPGQQAQSKDETLQVKEHADINAILAWKREMFSFQDADLAYVMRQLSRWYDVSVTYTGAIPARRFQGEIERNLPLKDVLDGLANIGVHFRVEGRRIIVMP